MNPSPHLEQASNRERDEHFMGLALALALRAADIGEVPVGAIVVIDDVVVGEGYNQPISQHDPSAHAEIVALRAAAQHQQNYRLVDASLFVTIEPCMMCAGALLHSRIKRLVYGAHEPKAGAIDTHNLVGASWQNHHLDVTSGILADRCGNLLSEFFRSRREDKT